MNDHPSFKKKLVHRGRYGNARKCRKCNKVIVRDELYIGKYHRKCYESLLIGD